jgi:hypothetical protein
VPREAAGGGCTDQEFVVEGILAEARHDGQLVYLVKWQVSCCLPSCSTRLP